MIPNITLTFIDNRTIQLVNGDSSSKVLAIQSLSPLGGWTSYPNLTVGAMNSLEVILGDSLYKLTLGSDSIVFIIYGNILNNMKIAFTTILNNPTNVNNPARYDIISLTLLGIIYLGNSTYQNVTYTSTPTIDADLLKIANAINDSTKYTDNMNNTPQSNLIWK